MQSRNINRLRRLIGLMLLGLMVVALAVAAADQVLVSVNYKNADLRDVLNALAGQAGVSLSMDETVTGVVSFHFENVSFDDCLNRLAAMFRLFVTREGRFYSITRQLIKITKDADGLISIELQSAKLGTALAELSRVGGVNLTVTGPAPADYLNLILNKMPLPDLIGLLAESSRCQVELRNGVYVFRAGGGGAMAIKYADGRLGVDLSGVPLATLVRELSTRTGLSVVCDQNAAAAQVSIFFNPLPLDEALNAIASANGLRIYKEGEHYRFGRGESPGAIRVRDGLLTLDVRNVEITDVLSELARQAGVSILPDRDVSGRVSGMVVEQPLEQGLTNFLEANGFTLEQDGGTFFIKRYIAGQSIIISVNEDGTIDLEVSNASLATAVTELAKKKNLSIVVYANVNWNITSVRLINTGFEEALNRLLSGTTFTFKKEGDTYLIGEGVNFRQGDTDFIKTEIFTLKNGNAEVIWNSLPMAFPRQNIILLKDSNAILVNGTPKLIEAFRGYLAKVDVKLAGVRTEVITLKHMKAEDALKLIPPSIPKTELMVVKETNSITVTGNEGYREQIRDFLTKIDVQAPMILFDVLVLQYTQNGEKSGGLSGVKLDLEDGTNTTNIFNWDLGSLIGTIISPGSEAARKLTVSIKVALNDGRAKVRANPKIATLSGSPAQFDVTTKYNYPKYNQTQESTPGGGTTTVTTPTGEFTTIESGIQLTMTPWVAGDKQITLELKPKISQFTTSPDVKDMASLPGVMMRSTQSTVRIMDGYTVVISGFVQESVEVAKYKFPILGDVPILGRLFQYEKKIKRLDEFVIVITPRLIEDPEEINKIMAQLSGPGSTTEPIVIDMDEDKKNKK